MRKVPLYQAHGGSKCCPYRWVSQLCHQPCTLRASQQCFLQAKGSSEQYTMVRGRLGQLTWDAFICALPAILTYSASCISFSVDRKETLVFSATMLGPGGTRDSIASTWAAKAVGGQSSSHPCGVMKPGCLRCRGSEWLHKCAKVYSASCRLRCCLIAGCHAAGEAGAGEP